MARISNSLHKEGEHHLFFEVKYLAIENLDKYLISRGASLISYQNQTDYFLEDKFYKSKNDVVLRLREVDGLATNLTLKTNYDIQKNNKKVEEYNLVDGFSEQNRKIDSMLTNFINCGFYVSTIVHKTRKEFMLNGQKIKLDYLNNNCYVELDNIELSKQQELEKLLFLGEQINESYYQINMQDLETCEHNECELKLKINSKIDDLSLKTFKKSTIFQTYLNLEDKNTLEFIYSFVPQNLDISAFSEARIRTVNNKSFLTLKSKGDLIRKEYEKEIPFCLTKKLKELPTNGRIEKVRYDIINLDDVVVTLDKYLNKNLNVIEAEFDDKKYSYDYVINLIQNQFPKFKFEDVTYNINYKNSNLAK